MTESEVEAGVALGVVVVVVEAGDGGWWREV